jgi:hypothetical protein
MPRTCGAVPVPARALPSVPIPTASPRRRASAAPQCSAVQPSGREAVQAYVRPQACAVRTGAACAEARHGQQRFQPGGRQHAAQRVGVGRAAHGVVLKGSVFDARGLLRFRHALERRLRLLPVREHHTQLLRAVRLDLQSVCTHSLTHRSNYSARAVPPVRQQNVPRGCPAGRPQPCLLARSARRVHSPRYPHARTHASARAHARGRRMVHAAHERGVALGHGSRVLVGASLPSASSFASSRRSSSVCCGQQCQASGVEYGVQRAQHSRPLPWVQGARARYCPAATL